MPKAKRLVLPAKPDACKSCPWYGDGTGFVPDEINEGAKILFIGARPGETEELTGKAHCGGNGKMIEGGIAKYGLTRKDASWINCVRCRYRHSSDKPANSFSDAQTYCRLAYPYPNPEDYRVIVPLDEESLKLVTGHEEMEKWRGSPIVSESGFGCGKLVLSTYHPSAIFQKPRLRTASKSDFRRIALAANGDTNTFEYRDQFYENESPEDFIERFRLWTQRDGFTVLDVETSRNKACDARLYIVGFAWAKDGAANCDWDRFSEAQVDEFKLLVQNAKCSLVTATPFDYCVLTKYGFVFNWRNCHDLTLLHSRFDIELPHTVEFIASTWTYRQYWKHLANTQPHYYNCLDCAAEWEAFDKIYRHCKERDESVLTCYENDRRSIRTAVKLHLTGMPCDKTIFKEEKAIYSKLRDEIETKLISEFESNKPALVEPPKCPEHPRYTGKTKLKLRKNEKEICGNCKAIAQFVEDSEPLNLRARLQVMKLLKDEGKEIPTSKKRKGEESFDKAAIEKLAVKYNDQRMVKLLEFKSLDKVISTYFKEARIGSDGRVHGNFNMHAAKHRWSCTDPNQQQVKRPEIINGEIHGPRCAYVCPEGRVFVGFDADGLHYRIAGCLSGDSFINTTLSRYDETKAPEFKPHVVNGAALFHVEKGQVIEWMHAKAPQYVFAKNFIYMILNGGTVPALHLAAVTAGLKFDVAEVEKLMNNWLEQAWRFRDWWGALMREAQRTGMITLFDGRRRRYYGLRYKDGIWHAGHDEEKEIKNHPLIGTEVSYVNPRVEKVVDFTEENPQWELVLYDHDGFMVMGPDSEADDVVKTFMPMLQEPMPLGPGKVLKVPWAATMGRTWASLKDYKGAS